MQFELRWRSGRELEIISVDTIDGAHTAQLYDVMQFPAILVVGDNGAVIKSWTDGSLPLLNELMFYMDQIEPTRQAD